MTRLRRTMLEELERRNYSPLMSVRPGTGGFVGPSFPPVGFFTLSRSFTWILVLGFFGFLTMGGLLSRVCRVFLASALPRSCFELPQPAIACELNGEAVAKAPNPTGPSALLSLPTGHDFG